MSERGGLNYTTVFGMGLLSMVVGATMCGFEYWTAGLLLAAAGACTAIYVAF